MDRQSWSIQLYYSDDSYSSAPIVLHDLMRFIKMRRKNAGNSIRNIKPINMWLLEYAIYKAQTIYGDKHVCKVIVSTGGN